MNDKYGKCYCGDCISFNKCKSDKGTGINLVSEGCSCFEPNDIVKFDYPILPKWLAEHDKQIRAEVIEKLFNTSMEEFGGVSLKEVYEEACATAFDDGWNVCYENFLLVAEQLNEQMQKGVENE